MATRLGRRLPRSRESAVGDTAPLRVAKRHSTEKAEVSRQTTSSAVASQGAPWMHKSAKQTQQARKGRPSSSTTRPSTLLGGAGTPFQAPQPPPRHVPSQQSLASRRSVTPEPNAMVVYPRQDTSRPGHPDVYAAATRASTGHLTYPHHATAANNRVCSSTLANPVPSPRGSVQYPMCSQNTTGRSPVQPPNAMGNEQPLILHQHLAPRKQSLLVEGRTNSLTSVGKSMEVTPFGMPHEGKQSSTPPWDPPTHARFYHSVDAVQSVETKSFPTKLGFGFRQPGMDEADTDSSFVWDNVAGSFTPHREKTHVLQLNGPSSNPEPERHGPLRGTVNVPFTFTRGASPGVGLAESPRPAEANQFEQAIEAEWRKDFQDERNQPALWKKRMPRIPSAGELARAQGREQFIPGSTPVLSASTADSLPSACTPLIPQAMVPPLGATASGETPEAVPFVKPTLSLNIGTTTALHIEPIPLEEKPALSVTDVLRIHFEAAGMECGGVVTAGLDIESSPTVEKAIQSEVGTVERGIGWSEVLLKESGTGESDAVMDERGTGWGEARLQERGTDPVQAVSVPKATWTEVRASVERACGPAEPRHCAAKFAAFRGVRVEVPGPDMRNTSTQAETHCLRSTATQTSDGRPNKRIFGTQTEAPERVVSTGTNTTSRIPRISTHAQSSINAPAAKLVDAHCDPMYPAPPPPLSPPFYSPAVSGACVTCSAPSGTEGGGLPDVKLLQALGAAAVRDESGVWKRRSTEPPAEARLLRLLRRVFKTPGGEALINSADDLGAVSPGGALKKNPRRRAECRSRHHYRGQQREEAALTTSDEEPAVRSSSAATSSDDDDDSRATGGRHVPPHRTAVRQPPSFPSRRNVARPRKGGAERLPTDDAGARAAPPPRQEERRRTGRTAAFQPAGGEGGKRPEDGDSIRSVHHPRLVRNDSATPFAGSDSDEYEWRLGSSYEEKALVEVAQPIDDVVGDEAPHGMDRLASVKCLQVSDATADASLATAVFGEVASNGSSLEITLGPEKDGVSTEQRMGSADFDELLAGGSGRPLCPLEPYIIPASALIEADMDRSSTSSSSSVESGQREATGNRQTTAPAPASPTFSPVHDSPWPTAPTQIWAERKEEVDGSTSFADRCEAARRALSMDEMIPVSMAGPQTTMPEFPRPADPERCVLLESPLSKPTEPTDVPLGEDLEGGGSTPSTLQNEPADGDSPILGSLESLQPVNLADRSPSSLSLEDIQEANRKNLALAKNAHVASLMQQRTPLDVEAAKRKLAQLNPAVDPQLLLDALMRGMSPTEAADHVTQNMTLEELRRIQIQQLKMQRSNALAALKRQQGHAPHSSVAGPDMHENHHQSADRAPAVHVPLEEARPDAAPGTATRVEDPNYAKVVHEVTHTLQIQMHPPDGVPRQRDVDVIKIYEDPLIQVLTEFLTAEECTEAMAGAEGRWEPEVGARCSFTARLPPSSILERITARVAAVAGTDVSFVQPLVLARYDPGGRFVPYLDGDLVSKTIMIFLNDIEEGGETDFPELGFQLRPQAGIAVSWPNVTADGEVDVRSAHASLPTETETKFALMCFIAADTHNAQDIWSDGEEVDDGEDAEDADFLGPLPDESGEGIDERERSSSGTRLGGARRGEDPDRDRDAAD